MGAVQFLGCFHLLVKGAGKRFGGDALVAGIQRGIQREVPARVRKQGQPEIEQRAAGVAVVLGIVQHCDVVGVAIFVEENRIRFQNGCQVDAKVFKPGNLYDRVHSLMNLVRHIGDFRKRCRKPCAGVLPEQFFQRDDLPVFRQKILAVTAAQGMPVVMDHGRFVQNMGVRHLRLLQKAADDDLRQGFIPHVIGLIPAAVRRPFELVALGGMPRAGGGRRILNVNFSHTAPPLSGFVPAASNAGLRPFGRGSSG